MPSGKAYQSEIVAMLFTPPNWRNAHTISVMRTIATKEPGIFLLIRGVNIIINSDRIPTANAHQLTSFQCSA